MPKLTIDAFASDIGQVKYNFTEVKDAMKIGKDAEERLKNGFKAWLEGPTVKRSNGLEIKQFAMQKDSDKELDKACITGGCSYTHKVNFKSQTAENLIKLFVRQLLMLEGLGFEDKIKRSIKGDDDYYDACALLFSKTGDAHKIAEMQMRIAKSEAMTPEMKGMFRKTPTGNMVKMFMCTDPLDPSSEPSSNNNPKGKCRGGRRRKSRRKRRRRTNKRKSRIKSRRRKSTKKKRRRRRR